MVSFLNSSLTPPLMTPEQRDAFMQEQARQAAAANLQASKNDDNRGGSDAVPNDKDPETYRAAYNRALASGMTPNLAARQAYEQAAPRANVKAHAEAKADGKPEGKAEAYAPALARDASAQAPVPMAEPAATSDSRGGKGTDLSTAPKAAKEAKAPVSLHAESSYETPKPEAAGGGVRTRQLFSDPAASKAPATLAATTPELKLATSEQKATTSEVAKIVNPDTDGSGSLDASEFYTMLMAEGAMTPEEAEATTTNVFADVKADAKGDVDAGTVGTFNIGEAQSKLAAAPPEVKKAVADTAQTLAANPQIVRALAESKSPDETQAIIAKGISDGILDKLTPKDKDGNPVAGMAAGGAGKTKGARSLNPMEMVMMAMMEAAIEGQNQAASLAKEVEANTELKRKLRGQKTTAGDGLQKDGLTGSSVVQKDGKTALTAAQSESISNFKALDDQLSGAGDDSSILMIKLQTAAQIVTTFLQACSNVSKGVTDTTKAVIGNIGH